MLLQTIITRRRCTHAFLESTICLRYSRLASAACHADDFAFTGNFNNINDVELFTVTFNSPGVTNPLELITYGYGGGVNVAGQTIASGGFDPSLAIFKGAGPSAVLWQPIVDDTSCSVVNPDPVTGQCYDDFFNESIDKSLGSTWSIALTDYSNFPNGGTLGEGFDNGALTGGTFIDYTGHDRDSHWALDILGPVSVTRTSIPASVVPEPSTILLFGSGLAGIVNLARKRLSLSY